MRVDEIVLSYSELAERLGIKLDSARKLARRKRWPKTVGNDGLAKVRVPVEELPPRNTNDNVPTDIRPDIPTDDSQTDLVEDPVFIRDTEEVYIARVSGLERLVEALTGRAVAAEADRDEWRRLAQLSWWERIFGKK